MSRHRFFKRRSKRSNQRTIKDITNNFIVAECAYQFKKFSYFAFLGGRASY